MMHLDVVSICFLLLLVLDSGALVDCTPKWEAGCNSYEIRGAAHPLVERIHSQDDTPLPADCRALCTSRTHCGGFHYWSIGKWCYLYNINNQIIGQVARVPERWYGNWREFTWYSKSCGYSLGDSDLTCDNYTESQYPKQYPNNLKWRLTYNSYFIGGLTATECQAWCTLYTDCRSVMYRNSAGRGECYLYQTTIQDLLDRGLDDDVVHNTDASSTYTTFDRYCGDGRPYVPGQATTTRPSVDLPTSVKTTTKTAIVTKTSTLSTLTSRPTEPPTDEAGSIGPLAQILIVAILLLLMGGVFMVIFVYRLKRRATDASNSTPTQHPLPGLPNSPAAMPEDDGGAVYEAVAPSQAGYVRPRSGPFVRGQQVTSGYNNPADLSDLVSQGSGIYTQMDGDQTNSAVIPEQPLGHLYENNHAAGSQHAYLQMAVPSGSAEQHRSTTLSSI